MRALSRLFGALLLLPALAAPALAAEAITDFQSQTVLQTDGSVDVTETIAVEAEGNQIRHGIFRNVFTVLRNADGSKFYTDFKVRSVTQDGHPEPFTVEGIPNGEQIRIGSADSYVETGPHTYVIHYSMSRQARFFPDHDELFWNITGNFWDFPILKASATITLPQGADISRMVAYTGPVGSTAQDATAQKTAPNVATFTANNELRPGDGLTIAVAFQKGIVAPPSGGTAGANWISDHREQVAPILLLLIVAAYNFWAWTRVGRDPKEGTIIPLFHPPEGVSPAETQWIHRMGFEGSGWNALTANLFDLGVKKLVTIDNRGGTLHVQGTGAKPDAPLPPDEQELYDYFGGNASRAVDKSTGVALNSRRVSMLGAITRPNRGKFFNGNGGYIFGGVALTIIAMLLMVWLDVLDPGWLIAAIVVGVVIAVVVGMIRGTVKGNSIFGIGFGIVWVALFAGNGLVALGHAASGSFPINPPALASISMALVTAFFGLIMRAPTAAGRAVMDKIDGFLMYLNTAEKNRLNLTGEPPLTIQRFEAILPFAIALGVEKPWSDKFNAALAAGQVPDATGAYHAPLWYSGGNFSDARSFSSNIAAATSAMSAAMASSVPSQSSSSGFSGGGGGGGSGGGGGGGGGGGW